MNLIIVESPTKAKTITKFLGSGYQIESSFGHIRDLPEKEIGVDIVNNFAPKYIILAKSKKNIAKLKELSSQRIAHRGRRENQEVFRAMRLLLFQPQHQRYA